ncbi:MAG: hypothetical protein K6A42_07505 [Treponema sp.]|nr:hypothetical protein [Treponema sp.]
MKAKAFLLATALALISGLAFGMSKNQSKVEVVGVLEWYGNAPFARLGLKDKEQNLYYLKASDEDLKKIGALSGNIVSVNGILTGEQAPVEMASAIVLKVKSWKKAGK